MPDNPTKQTAATSPRNDLAIPAGLIGDVQPIAEEVHRIHEAAMWSAQGQFEQMNLWRLTNLRDQHPAGGGHLVQRAYAPREK